MGPHAAGDPGQGSRGRPHDRGGGTDAGRQAVVQAPAVAGGEPAMKIDVFCHISPPRYHETVLDLAPAYKDMGRRLREIPALFDMDVRFRIMDAFGEYRQIPSL